MTAVMFLAFILFLILSFPVAIAMGLSSCVPALIDSSFSADFVYIIRTMVVGIDSTPILAIPLFIISGTMMAQGGISGKLFDVFSYFLGNKTGGLLCATIATCLFYGAISGSGPATCAAVGAMAIPLLVSLGYDKAFCSAMVATAGGLGLIIPPSISFVNYALVTGTSVTSLFMAGILPGCLIGNSVSVVAVSTDTAKHARQRDVGTRATGDRFAERNDISGTKLRRCIAAVACESPIG